MFDDLDSVLETKADFPGYFRKFIVQNRPSSNEKAK